MYDAQTHNTCLNTSIIPDLAKKSFGIQNMQADIN